MLQAVQRLWRRFTGTAALAAVGPSYRLTDPAAIRLFGSVESSAGACVTPETSLTLSAVFAGVSLLARVIGSLPLDVYRQNGRNKDKATTHPAYRVLHDELNGEMTASIGRAALEWNRLLYGAAAAEIGWDGGGNPRALWPLEGWRVRPMYDQAERLYFLVDGTRRVDPADMVYVPQVGCDGVVGRGFVHYAVESLGLGITAQEFAARYFGSGATPGGILSHDREMKPSQREEIREGWEAKHRKANVLGILWGGWKYQPMQAANARDAQLLEARKFTTEEVARWLGIPPHLLAELSRATFSNIEEQGLGFLAYSLGPTLVQYEQEYGRKLLTPPKLYAKHNVRALLRGNAAQRAAYYHTLLGDGVTNINEVRDLEDWNPIEGGDEHFVPLNMQPLKEALKPMPDPKPQPPPSADPAAPPANDPPPYPDPTEESDDAAPDAE